MSNGTISAILAGSSAALVKDTTNTVTLTGANTYGGGTTVTDGTLTLTGVAATLGASGGSLVVDANYSGTAILSLGTASPTVGTVSLLNGGQITSSTGTLTGTAFNVESGSITAKLAGSGSLTKANTGTVTISGTNSYTGLTQVNAGVLQFTKVASLPGQTTVGQIRVAGGATLGLNLSLIHI